MAGEIKAQREVGVGGLQMEVDQEADRDSLHFNALILSNLGTHLAIRSEAKKLCWLVWKVENGSEDGLQTW